MFMDGTDRFVGEFAHILLAFGRNPARMLRRQGVCAEIADRMSHDASRHDLQTIVYSISPGRVHVLTGWTGLKQVHWVAQMIILTNLYFTAEDALTAAKLEYKRLKRRSVQVVGWGRTDYALVRDIMLGAHRMLDAEFLTSI
jgi:hypothetical protein